MVTLENPSSSSRTISPGQILPDIKSKQRTITRTIKVSCLSRFLQFVPATKTDLQLVINPDRATATHNTCKRG